MNGKYDYSRVAGIFLIFFGVVVALMFLFLNYVVPTDPEPIKEKPMPQIVLKPEKTFETKPPEIKIEIPKPVPLPIKPKPEVVITKAKYDGKVVKASVNKSALKKKNLVYRLNIGYCSYDGTPDKNGNIEIKPEWSPPGGKLTFGVFNIDNGKYVSSVRI